MHKLSQLTLILTIFITVVISVTLLWLISSTADYRRSTEESLKKINQRMTALDINISKAITSKQMSGHLITIRANQKKILANIEKVIGKKQN